MGFHQKDFDFGVRAFLCTLLLAAVSKPILGVDFLSANHLLFDPHFCQVLDANTLDPISGSESVSRRSGLAAALCHVTSAVHSLLATFPAIVCDGSGAPNPMFSIPSKPQAVQFSQSSGVLIRKNTGSQKPNSETWKRPESSADPILHGLHNCTWSQKRTGLGVHAGITADSIWPQNMTGTPCPPSWICQQSFHC
jgi:hypothetical protein